MYLLRMNGCVCERLKDNADLMRVIRELTICMCMRPKSNALPPHQMLCVCKFI